MACFQSDEKMKFVIRTMLLSSTLKATYNITGNYHKPLNTYSAHELTIKRHYIKKKKKKKKKKREKNR